MGVRIIFDGVLYSKFYGKILFNCPNKRSDSDPIPTWLLKVCTSGGIHC